jgi:ABC-2 type transport system ATP-binding protein
VQSLVLSGVARSFGSTAAVRDISFTVAAGATFGLLGPNGAGKTTTMRMIFGIIVPDHGEITWDGGPIDADVRMRFGYLPEERGLYGGMRVRDQIAYFGRLHGLRSPSDRTSTERWLTRLDLEWAANLRCSELSKGNQQKVQFACAVVHAPELVVLDEPFTGLDPANADVILKVLRELAQEGVTLILSTHQLWQIQELCDTFCIIAAGMVRASGTLAELRASWPERRIEVEPAEPALRRVLDALPGVRAGAPLPGNGVANVLAYDVPTGTDTASILRRLVAAGDVTRFEQIDPSLQEIYARTTGVPV